MPERELLGKNSSAELFANTYLSGLGIPGCMVHFPADIPVAKATATTFLTIIPNFLRFRLSIYDEDNTQNNTG
jgi:hypothetical protein